MGNGTPKSFNVLAGYEGYARFGERSRHHDWHFVPRIIEVLLDGEEAGFQVESVDDRFGYQDIGACFNQRRNLALVRIDHLVECDGSKAGVIHLGGYRHLLCGGADRARVVTRLERR